MPPLFYRELSWRDLPGIFADSARLSGVIGLIIGLVGAFGWVLTYSKFPFRVAAAITAVAPTWWLFLVIVIALYIFLGTFLTPSEIILVTVPVLLPAAQALGIHPIHFGMVYPGCRVLQVAQTTELLLDLSEDTPGKSIERADEPSVVDGATLINHYLAILPGSREPSGQGDAEKVLSREPCRAR